MIRLKRDQLNKIVLTLGRTDTEYKFIFRNATTKKYYEVELERQNEDNIRYDEFHLFVDTFETLFNNIPTGTYTYEVYTLQDELVDNGIMIVEGERQEKKSFEKQSKIRKSYERN